MDESKVTRHYCNTKNKKKKVGKNFFAWLFNQFYRNKLIPKTTINGSLLRPRRGRVAPLYGLYGYVLLYKVLFWLLCPKHGVLFCASMS